jgi:hypothetical protein
MNAKISHTPTARASYQSSLRNINSCLRRASLTWMRATGLHIITIKSNGVLSQDIRRAVVMDLNVVELNLLHVIIIAQCGEGRAARL